MRLLQTFNVLVCALLLTAPTHTQAFSASDARTCGRIVGAMGACGFPRSDQEAVLSPCMDRVRGTDVQALLDGVEEGSWLSPNTDGWSCQEVRDSVRRLRN